MGQRSAGRRSEAPYDRAAGSQDSRHRRPLRLLIPSRLLPNLHTRNRYHTYRVEVISLGAPHKNAESLLCSDIDYATVKTLDQKSSSLYGTLSPLASTTDRPQALQTVSRFRAGSIDARAVKNASSGAFFCANPCIFQIFYVILQRNSEIA